MTLEGFEVGLQFFVTLILYLGGVLCKWLVLTCVLWNSSMLVVSVKQWFIARGNSLVMNAYEG